MNQELTDRELKILQCRFIEGKTLEATGKIFGVTRERIRQIEAKGIEKIKHIDGDVDDINKDNIVNKINNLLRKVEIQRELNK